MVEFKEVDVTYGVYGGVENGKIKIPVNVPWVRYDKLVGNSLTKGHTNYWTIIPDTISNKKVLADAVFRVDYCIFNGLILLTLDNFAPIPELEITDWKNIYDKYNLKDLVGVVVNTVSFNVLYVCRIVELEHPNDAIVHFVDFKNYIGGFMDNKAMTINNSEILNLLSRPFKAKIYILDGDKAKLIWNEAMKTFLSEFNCEEYESKIKWESGITDDDDWDVFVAKSLEMINQFN